MNVARSECRLLLNQAFPPAKWHRHISVAICLRLSEAANMIKSIQFLTKVTQNWCFTCLGIGFSDDRRCSVEDTLASHHSVVKAPFLQEVSSHKLQPFLCAFQIPEVSYFLVIPYPDIKRPYCQ